MSITDIKLYDVFRHNCEPDELLQVIDMDVTTNRVMTFTIGGPSEGRVNIDYLVSYHDGFDYCISLVESERVKLIMEEYEGV